ncbi:MAG: radical SAM protein [bacterium]|nr:MAG: radical SAM protein [bacterium]
MKSDSGIKLKNFARTLNSAIQFNLLNKRNLIKVGHRITHKCNYKCSYCSVWYDKTEELNTEQILKLVDEVADAGCVAYAVTGGEPLIRKDLPQILKRIKERGMVAKLVSNGSLVSKRIDEIADYVDVLTFSFDTINPNVPEDLGIIKVLNDTVIEGVKAAVARIPHVGFNTILTRITYDQLDDILEIGTSLGIKSFTFSPLLTHFDYKSPEEYSRRYAEVYGSIEHYRKTIRKLRELRDKGYPVMMSDLLLDAMYTFKVPKMKCIAIYLQCSISPDGRLGPCFEFSRELTDSYNNKSFKELWEELGDHIAFSDNCKGCLLHCYFEPSAIFAGKPKAIFSRGSYRKRYINALFNRKGS